METTIIINNFAMVTKTKKDADKFIKELDKLCSEYEKDNSGYFDFEYE